MRILILGGDGYLGWPTAMSLSAKGHEIGVVDNFMKRACELEIGVEPLIPVPSLFRRIEVWRACTGHQIEAFIWDLRCQRDARSSDAVPGAGPGVRLSLAQSIAEIW